jgi:hypothetical protein
MHISVMENWRKQNSGKEDLMAARVHRPLKVIAFNANAIWRRRYELSKQLLCSHRHVSNPMRGSSFQIITFIGLTASREEKAELPLH